MKKNPQIPYLMLDILYIFYYYHGLVHVVFQELEEKLEILLKAFQEAVNEKMKCQAEADATNATIDLANRLVNGLASEKIR